MVEATPATWRDVCERCEHAFDPGESRWIEQRQYTVHTACADWSTWEQPPYSWKLKELRKQYRQADSESRSRIVQAGQAIRAMQAEWPSHAVEHVQRVIEAVRELG
jgi:hypothetical protein